MEQIKVRSAIRGSKLTSAVLPSAVAIAVIVGAISTPAARGQQIPDKNARAQWVLQQRMSNPYSLMQGCTPNVGWPNFDLLKFVCNDEGYDLKALQYKDGSSPSDLLQIRSLGFKAVLLTQSNLAIIDSKPDVYLVVTPSSLAKPTPDSIPVENSARARWEYVELMYARWRQVPQCQASVFGEQNDGIYVACPGFAPKSIDATYSRSDVATSLDKRGFKTVIYGNQQQFWPATIEAEGFIRKPATDGATLFKTYGLRTSAMIAARDSRDDEYHKLVEDSVRQLLDYAVKRKYVSLHSRPSGNLYAWSFPVDDDEKSLFDKLDKRGLAMERSDSDASLKKDLDAQAKILYSGGKWEPFAGTMARYYVTVAPGSKTAPTLDDLLREIQAALNCEGDYCTY